VLEAVQQRLDENPQMMRQRRETVEHPFATLKMRMGATHFLMKRLPKVATEMALHVLAYNLTRVMKRRRRSTARGGDEGIVALLTPLSLTQAARTDWFHSGTVALRKSPQMREAASVSTRPRPISAIAN
jgi:Transposase DDE domain